MSGPVTSLVEPGGHEIMLAGSDGVGHHLGKKKKKKKKKMLSIKIVLPPQDNASIAGVDVELRSLYV